jgi:hypothetical protein
MTMPAAANLTAAITSGGGIFKVVGIVAYELVLVPVDQNELPHPVPLGGAGSYWEKQNPVSSDGVRPLAVKQGQLVYLNVAVNVPNGTLPPGSFSGNVVMTGGAAPVTVPLQGTYLAVDVNTPIGQKWLALGGEAKLGDVLSNTHRAADDQGNVQEFANGAIYEVTGPLPSKTSAYLPGLNAVVASAPAAPAVRPVGRAMVPAPALAAGVPPPALPSLPVGTRLIPLAPGVATVLAAPKVFLFSNGIYMKWTSLANSSDAGGHPVWSALGPPQEDSFATVEGGQALRFQGGVIVVRATQNAFVVYGAINTRYAQIGNLSDPNHQPFLGLPVSDEQPALAARGRVSHFDGGDIYWDLNIGAHGVHGAIRQHWIDLGGPGGFLGFPVTDETGTPDGIGRFNRFENGMIYWTPATAAHEVHGAILDRWSALGYEKSYLGYPVSDEGPSVLLVAGIPVLDRRSYFQFGRLDWTDSTGVVETPDSVSQGQQVLTPAGTALGGNVTINLFSNGNYAVQFQMHDSGAPDYDFQVHAIFTTPNGLSLVAAHSGHVEGTVSWTPWHDPNRDDNFTDNGNNPWIQMHWVDISSGKLMVTKDYSPTGVIGFVQDLAQTVLDLGASAVGGALGLVIGLGSEIGKVFGNLGIGGVFGLIAGAVVFAFTGGVVLAIVAGVAVGAVTNALIKQRQISQAEYDLANQVFQGTLPPPNQLILTNMAGLGGRAFTMPGIDGNIYINLGDAFDQPDPIDYTANRAYPVKGELLVHELTHAWQIHNATFLPGFVCDGIVNQANYLVGQSVYTYGPPGPPWGSFNLEAQGAIVDQWFGGIQTPVVPYRNAMDKNDPYFGYIANNIRTGQT